MMHSHTYSSLGCNFDRNEEKTLKAISTIKEATSFTRMEFWQLDLASFDSVKAFGKKYIESGNALDVLVNNAGVVIKEWRTTKDGYETTYVFCTFLSNIHQT